MFKFNDYCHDRLKQELVPALRYDPKEDFAAWRETIGQKLNGLLGMDKFERLPVRITVEYEKEHDGYREIRFVYNSEKNCDVPAHLLIPKKIKKTKYPLAICLQGHTAGMHISLGIAICFFFCFYAG